MTRRRLERANQRREVGSAVPVELGDPGHPLWESEDAVDALAEDYDLPEIRPREAPFLDPARERFRAFLYAFCVSRNLLHPEWRTLDHKRIREAGISAEGGRTLPADWRATASSS